MSLDESIVEDAALEWFRLRPGYGGQVGELVPQLREVGHGAHLEPGEPAPRAGALAALLSIAFVRTPSSLRRMATCLFVASGLDFAVDEYLRASPFKPHSVFYKGAVPPKGNPDRIARPDSGFVVIVGDDQEPEVHSQQIVAMEFLIRHEPEFRRLRKLGVDKMLLDFGVVRGHSIQESSYFPSELIQAMARLDMGIMVSTVLLPKG